MKRSILWLGSVLIAGAVIVSAILLSRDTDPVVSKIYQPHVTGVEPGMCAWKNPSQDLSTLFPNADKWQQHTFFLTGLRIPIQNKLGPNATLGFDVLYYYTISQGSQPRGTVLVQRCSGEYGAIEEVVGIDMQGRVTGVILQRYREPDQIANVIASRSWLKTFDGKSANNLWKMGKDISNVPPVAKQSAQSVVDTTHTLVVAYSEVSQTENHA